MINQPSLTFLGVRKRFFNWETYRAEESCLQQITYRRPREFAVGEEKLFGPWIPFGGFIGTGAFVCP